MPEDFKRHILHYLILFSILGLGILGFWYFSYNPLFKRGIVLTVAALYLTWGVFHHFLERNLNFKIMIEYTLIAILAATVLLIIIGAPA